MPAFVASDVVPPLHLWRPPQDRSHGAEVVGFIESLGVRLDPEQCLVLDAMYARRGARWAAMEVALVAPRQNIKTHTCEMACLADLFLFGGRDKLIIWTAHLFPTANEAFIDLKSIIDQHDFLSSRVARITEAAGNQGIELVDGTRLKLLARSKSGGRGFSGTKIYLDESFALTPNEVGSLLPTLSAQPDPQVVYASSAGRIDSAVLRSLRDRGRRGDDASLAYVEWAAEPGDCSPNCLHHVDTPGCVLDDRARWRQANTATGRRITMEFIAAERRALPPLEFMRERLGWWEDPPPDDVRDKLFPQWPARAGNPTPAPGARMALGIDTAWDRSATWIAAATELPDGRIRGEVVATGPGTGWVRKWLTDRLDSLTPTGVAMQASGAPVSTLHEELALHVPDAHRDRLKGLTAADMARASGLLFDLIDRDGLAHVPHPALDDAAGEAIAKPMSDAWVIDRKKSGTDVSPLVALSAAVAALVGDATPPPMTTEQLLATFG